MSSRGFHTWSELCSQPVAWRQASHALQQQLADKPIAAGSHIIWSGCGSPFYLAASMARMTQQYCDVPSMALPASEIWCNPEASLPRNAKPTLILLSRSGSTTEVLRAAERFRKQIPNGKIITISCYADRPLAQMGDINIVLPSGQEQSIAQTRAFTVLQMGAIAVLCRIIGQSIADIDQIPDIAAKVIDQYQQKCVEIGADSRYQQFFFLGSGLRYGLASEGSLKMKEMSLTTSEPFHHMEFRHGPQSMVDDKTLVISLGSITTNAQEQAVLADMRALGGHTLSIGPTPDCDMHWQSSLPDALQAIIALPLLQSIAYSRSISRGLDPDNPHNLNAVVVLPQ